MWRRVGCALVLLLGSWAAHLLAATVHESLHLLPSPGAQEWADQTFPRIERHTRYKVVETRLETGAPSVPAYLATSDCAASGKIVPLSDVDLIQTPILSWSWKVIRGLDIVDERTPGGDDFAARVYVLFGFDAQSASLRERFAHRLYSDLLRHPMPGSALNYIFASRLARGTSWVNPSQSNAHMIALRTGSAAAATSADSEAGWYHESVDVLADHRRFIALSGSPQAVAVALMTDSDATCAAAEALYAGFRFQARQRGRYGDGGATGDAPKR